MRNGYLDRLAHGAYCCHEQEERRSVLAVSCGWCKRLELQLGLESYEAGLLLGPTGGKRRNT